MSKNSIIIPAFLLAGLALGYVLGGGHKGTGSNERSSDNPPLPVDSPFSPASDSERLAMLEDEVAQIHQQLAQIKQTLAVSTDNTAASDTDTLTAPTDTPAEHSNHRKPASSQSTNTLLNQRLYNLDNLIRGGIDPTIAEDIVRRKNRVELSRLQLQDKARREGYLDTQRYYDELEAINSNDVDLREELGDEAYDRYLYNSHLTNRVRVSSVMLGSAAEEAGLRKNDIILSYNNKRVFNWRELKQATAEGELGEYVSITIVRDGSIYSLNVPRGPLGIQLGVARVEP